MLDTIFVHDVFNMLSLTIIVILDILYLISATKIEYIGTPELGVGSEYIFNIFFTVFGCYVLADTLWIIIKPNCVMSNIASIIFHHIATILYMTIPWVDPQFSWHMSVCLLVEINTILLTIRRNLKKENLPHRICELLFYISWIVLRLILYPCLIPFMIKEYYRYTLIQNTWINIMLMAPIFQIILTSMGVKWTWDLGRKFLVSKKKEQSN